MADRNNSTLWKGYSDKNGLAVLLTTQDFGDGVQVVDASTGQVLETAKFDTIANGGRYHYRFSRPGSAYKNVFIIGANGKAIYLANGGGDAYGFNIQQAKQNSGHTQEQGKGKWDWGTLEKSAGPDYAFEGSGYSNVDGILGTGNVAAPQLLDPALAGKEIEFTDPIDTLRNIAKENQGIVNENTLIGMQQAGLLSEGDLAQLTRYLNTMSPLQMQLVGIENQFNQQQKLQAAEKAMPGIQDILNGEIKNAQTLASGRLLTSIEDRAFEQTARNAGADAAWTRGLGDDSLAGKRLSDQLSVSQRMQLMQQGQSYMNASVQLAANVLMDSPNKAALSQQIPGTPMNAFSTIAAQQQANLNQYSTINGEAAVNAQTTNYWNYINKRTEIEAANLQAVNEFNQNVINDANQTAMAEAKSQAYAWLAWLDEHNKVTAGTDQYAAIVAQIEATGSFDPSTYFSDFWKEYQKSTTNGTSSTISGDHDSGHGTKVTDDNGNKVTTYSDGSKIIQYKDKVTITSSSGNQTQCDVVKYINADGSGRIVFRYGGKEVGVVGFDSNHNVTSTGAGNTGTNYLDGSTYNVGSIINDSYSPGTGGSSGSGGSSGNNKKLTITASGGNSTSSTNEESGGNSTTSSSTTASYTTKVTNAVNSVVTNSSSTNNYKSWNDLLNQYLGNSTIGNGGMTMYNSTPTSKSITSALNPTYVAGKIVQTNGTVTLPTQNKTYKPPVTFLDYLTLGLLNS